MTPLTVLSLLLKAVAPIIDRLLLFYAGNKHEEAINVREDLEARTKEAQAWADSPRSMDDFTDRVCALADRKRQDRS